MRSRRAGSSLVDVDRRPFCDICNVRHISKVCPVRLGDTISQRHQSAFLEPLRRRQCCHIIRCPHHLIWCGLIDTFRLWLFLDIADGVLLDLVIVPRRVVLSAKASRLPVILTQSHFNHECSHSTFINAVCLCSNLAPCRRMNLIPCFDDH